MGVDEGLLWVQVHVLDTAPRTSALWGTSTLLASAANKCITVRSLETGGILLICPQNDVVVSLSGMAGGRLLTSAGRSHVASRDLGYQARVAHEVKGINETWIEAVWGDGNVLAWAGRFVTVALAVMTYQWEYGYVAMWNVVLAGDSKHAACISLP